MTSDAATPSDGPGRSVAPPHPDASGSTPRADWRFGLAAAAVFAALLVPRILAHEMWRDEWHTWLMAKASPDLGLLLARARYDGHPLTWYVLTWIATKLTATPVSIKLIHAAIATLFAGTIAVAAPWRRSTRVLLMCGYFVAFEYAVISRNYSLGAVGYVLLAAAVARWPRRPVPAALAVALIIHSNAFAALMAAPLTLCLLWRFYRQGASRPALAGALAIMAVSAGLVLVETHAPPDLQNTPLHLDASVGEIGRLASAPWRAFVPVPELTRSWWNTNVLNPLSHAGPLRVVQPALGLALVALLTLLVSRRTDARLAWLASVSLMLIFGALKIEGSIRHHGNLVVLFAIIRWIEASRGDLPADAGWRRIAIGGLIGVQAAVGIGASLADLAMPFTAARATAERLRRDFPDALIIAHRDYEGSPIAGYLGRPVYFPMPGIWSTYIHYDNRRSDNVTPEQLTEAARKLQAEFAGRQIVCVAADGADTRPSESTFVGVARFDDSSVQSERYLIYRYRETP